MTATVTITNSFQSLPQQFSAAMEGLGAAAPPTLAVAVSGGADSMALALLAQGWARNHGGSLTALTVDHRLRPESTAEARQVAEWMQIRGIPHHTLTWEHDGAPGANLQMEAREARYQLLTEWCAAHDIEHLLLAHHLDDQAETFLMRLARGSGVDGLTAMRPANEWNGVTLLRPLLSLRKQALTTYLTAQQQAWLEDPSNHNPAYSRTHARQWLAESGRLGVSEEALAATGERMARARDALEHYTAEALTRHARLYEEGCARLDYEALHALPEEIGLRLLSHLLCAVGGQVYRHRFQQLEAIFHAIRRQENFSQRTIGGCLLSMQDKILWILREPAACSAPAPLIPGEPLHWDRRFALHLAPNSPAELNVAALSAEGWHAVRPKQNAAFLHIAPKEVFYSLPALFRLEKPVAVPHMGWYDDAQLQGRLMVRFRPLKSLPGERYHVLMDGV